MTTLILAAVLSLVVSPLKVQPEDVEIALRIRNDIDMLVVARQIALSLRAANDQIDHESTPPVCPRGR